MTKPNPLDSELAKQVEVRHLIVHKGFSKKEAAKKAGVSEKTVTDWIIEFKWVKPGPMDEKKQEAKKLLAMGYNQKTVSEMIDVSDKTIGVWVKKYRWLSKKSFETPTLKQVEFAVARFISFVDNCSPELSAQLQEISLDFYKDEGMNFS